jgi:6-phosphofructokinase 1
VIRGVVKSASRAGYEILGFLHGFEGLLQPNKLRELTLENTAGILIQGGTILKSSNRGHFVSRVGIDGVLALDPAVIAQVRQTFDQQQLEGLVCIGGDGSLSTALQLWQAGLPVVGVPKTIDNDLGATAFTFGFDSAVACAVDALDRLHTTAASHERIMVLEVMGRHAGWIALHAGLAGGADAILIPEIPWDYEQLCAKIRERNEAHKNFTIIVVAEGARLPNGALVERQPVAQDRQAQLGGIGMIISQRLQELTSQEARCVILGHLQRGGTPTNFDRALATQLGVHAVQLIEQRQFGQMVCYHPPEMHSAPIAEAVAQLRTVDANCSALVAARAMGICVGSHSDSK